MEQVYAVCLEHLKFVDALQGHWSKFKTLEQAVEFATKMAIKYGVQVPIMSIDTVVSPVSPPVTVVKWEAIKPKRILDSLKIDDPIMVRNYDAQAWMLSFFYKKSGGRVRAWSSCRTSKGSSCRTSKDGEDHLGWSQYRLLTDDEQKKYGVSYD